MNTIEWDVDESVGCLEYMFVGQFSMSARTSGQYADWELCHIVLNNGYY